MNKRKLLCLLLIFAISISLTSCDIVDIIKYGHTYTGGYIDGPLPPEHYRVTKFCWVETLDELIVIVGHLRASENEFLSIYIPDYENETVDAKYCITYNFGRTINTEGKKWYDLQGINITSIRYYGFLEEVSIEELVHSYIVNYKCFYTYGFIADDRITSDTKLYYDQTKRDNGKYALQLMPEGTDLAWIEYYNMEDPLSELPENYIIEFSNSFVLIGE